jgi:hypothetical protein
MAVPFKSKWDAADVGDMDADGGREVVAAEVLAALGGLPAEVQARTASGAAYSLTVRDVVGGELVGSWVGDVPLQPRTELTFTVRSGHRNSHSIECFVRDCEQDRIRLVLRSVSRVRGRRRSARSATDALFLVYDRIEIDAEVTSISTGGMRINSPIQFTAGNEVRGMLNLAGQVFPLAAEVRYCKQHADRFEVGLEFRMLRADELAILESIVQREAEGRRAGEGVAAEAAPSQRDIRERLRRWAA